MRGNLFPRVTAALSLLLVCGYELFPTALQAQQSAAKRLPTTALISADENVVIPLFEAKLLESTQAKWLERNEIKRLLEEQKLGAAFEAAGGKDRLSLGKLLKADLLVLVRTVDSPVTKGDKLLECVVCETKQGLRLQVAHVPAADKPEAAAGSLLAAFTAALAKQQETVREVVAVPPLVSDDLGFDKNHLQTTYAKRLEQALLAQPGVVVVELGEAQAIARELAIAGDDRLDRGLAPLFLLGNYRHRGVAEKTTLSLKLRLLRGEQQIARRETSELAPLKAGEWLSDSARELLSETRSLKVVPSNPASEARQLVQRAGDFYRIGNWVEALSLYEASLLIQPRQEEVLRQAITCCEHLVRSNYNPARPKSRADIEPQQAIYRRGLAHVEAFLSIPRQESKYGQLIGPNAVQGFEVSQIDWTPRYPLPADVIELLQETGAMRTEVYVARARARAADGYGDEGWPAMAMRSIPQEKRPAFAIGMMEEFADLPDGKDRAKMLGFNFCHEHETPEYGQLIASMKASRHAAVREAAPLVEEQTAKRIAILKLREQPVSLPSVRELTLTPVSLRTPVASENASVTFACLAAGKGTDVFWGWRRVYLMREKGQLTWIWGSDDQLVTINSLVFDGKYVWFTTTVHQRPARLYVFQPGTRGVAQFKHADGLPQADEVPGEKIETQDSMIVAPISPGNVCVMGQSGRTWLATATYDGAKKKVEIFQEARQQVNFREKDQEFNAAILFQPAFAYPLAADKAAATSVLLVGRSAMNSEVRYRPLVVDPVRKQVSVSPFQLHCEKKPQEIASDGRSMYLLVGALDRAPQLVRRSLTGDEEVVLSDVAEGHLCMHEGLLHIVGRQWHVVDLEKRTKRLVLSPTPWRFDEGMYYPGKSSAVIPPDPKPGEVQLAGLHVSQHYGLLAFARNDRWIATVLSAALESKSDKK